METYDHLEKGSAVLVQSAEFGRMGLASVRYCSRIAVKFKIGLSFGTGLRLSDPSRREILEKVVRKPASNPE